MAEQITEPTTPGDGNRPVFEIPDTEKSRAFVTRNPRFPAAILRLTATANKCFGRNPRSKNRLEHICFWLGHTCRQDFFEIVFLAVNGYGAGATKILRSLYERAVTIAYLIQNPDKVEQFFQFAAIQEHRAMQAALTVVPEAQFDAAMGPANRVAEIRKRYNEHKGNFKATACEKCGVKTPPSWDLDLVSMIRRVGKAYEMLLVLAYTSPNFLIHATVTSAEPRDEKREQWDAEVAVTTATGLLLGMMRYQDELFSLDLDADIETCEKDLSDWQEHQLSRT